MTPYFAMFLFVVLGSISSALLAFGEFWLAAIPMAACLAGIVALQGRR